MRAEISLIALPLVISSFIGLRTKNHSTSTIRSKRDGRLYNVRSDVKNPELSAEILAELRRRMGILFKYLDTERNPYHRRLVERFNYTILRENPLKVPSPAMTSYSINKGEEIVMCLRNPASGIMHDIDTLMYVLLHEAAHIACPEVGHTSLFVKIFADLLRIASRRAHIINKTDYHTVPVHYCGMTISENIL